MKRVAVFAWARGAGWRGRVPLGDGGRPSRGKGTRSIAARPRVRAGCLAEPDLSAGLRDSTVVRAHASAAGAPKKKGWDPALGRSRAGLSTQIHILADQRGSPLCLSLTGDPGLSRGLDRAAPALPDRGSGLRQRRLPRLAGATGHRGCHSGPEPASEPPAPRPGTIQGAQRRRTGHRLAQAWAARGHPLRQIRTSFLGLSVSGRGLDLDEAKVPQNQVLLR